MTRFSFQSVTVASENFFDAKLSPLLVNSTYCEFSLVISKNSVTVTCSLQVPSSSVGVVEINGSVADQIQV